MKIIFSILSKGNKKIRALAKMSKYIPDKQLGNNENICHFTICMVPTDLNVKRINRKINKLHGRVLRVAVKIIFLHLKNIFHSKDKSVTVHQKNLQMLLRCIIYFFFKKILKQIWVIGPKIWDIFSTYMKQDLLHCLAVEN